MTRTGWRPAPLILAAVVVLSIAGHVRHGPALGWDDHGQYLLHARALIESRPYTDIGFVHSEYSTLVAPLAEPPGLPVIIAGVFAVAGEDVGAARGILWVSFAVLAWCLFGYWKRHEGEGTALLVAAWTLLALARLHALDTMLADLPFCAAVWLAFAVADDEHTGGGAIGRLALLGLFGALAFSFRMAALPLLPAAATALLVRPRGEGLTFLGAGAIWTAVAAAVMFGFPAAQVLAGETVRTWSVLLRDAGLNAREFLEGLRLWVPIDLHSRPLNNSLLGFLLVLVALGAVQSLREFPRRFAYITAVWYVVMLVLLPTRSARYLWPLFPFVTFALARGVRLVLSRLAPTRQAGSIAGRERIGDSPGWAGTPSRALIVAATVLLAVGLAQDLARPAPRTFNTDPDVQQVVRLFKSMTGDRDSLRVLIFSPRVFTWETRLVSLTPFAAAPEDMLRFLRRERVTHVVTGDAGTSSQGSAEIAAIVRERPLFFQNVLTNGSFSVYRVTGMLRM